MNELEKLIEEATEQLRVQFSENEARGTAADEDAIINIMIAKLTKTFKSGAKAMEEAIAPAHKILMPTKEPPKNNLSQNQIFGSGQMNMAMRIDEHAKAFWEALNKNEV